MLPVSLNKVFIKLGYIYGSFFSQTLNENRNQAYANGIKLFCDFLTAQVLEDILDIEPKHVTEFVGHMSDGEYDVATTRLYLSAIRGNSNIGVNV